MFTQLSNVLSCCILFTLLFNTSTNAVSVILPINFEQVKLKDSMKKVELLLGVKAVDCEGCQENVKYIEATNIINHKANLKYKSVELFFFNGKLYRIGYMFGSPLNAKKAIEQYGNLYSQLLKSSGADKVYEDKSTLLTIEYTINLSETIFTVYDKQLKRLAEH